MQSAVAFDVLRNDAFRLVVGELIGAAGVLALILHLFRPRSTDRSTLYFGLAAFLYGLRLIVELDGLHSVFPFLLWNVLNSSITLVIGIPFALYLGSTLGQKYPWFTRAVVFTNLLLALFGAVRLIQHRSLDDVWFINGIIIVVALAGWIYIGIFPRIPIDREVRALRVGLLVLGLFSLYQNLAVIGVLPKRGFQEWMGMLFLMGTFLYVSASRNYRQETNLIAIRNELDIARQIQSALLPRLDEAMAGMEIHARYSPAGSVAGDFYDVLTDGQGIGVLIADVSGHGVPAAISASMLKVALRAQMDCLAEPAKVLHGLNKTLSGMLGTQFITAAYVYFDSARRELSYGGAGHPPVLLWRSKGKKVETLEENGLFLGPFPQALYSSRRAPFEPGDRCLLYTDGVVEASNARDEEFGSTRLKDFLALNSGLSADSACTALLEQVSAWSGGKSDSQQDDISFVAIEFQAVGSSPELKVPLTVSSTEMALPVRPLTR